MIDCVDYKSILKDLAKEIRGCIFISNGVLDQQMENSAYNNLVETFQTLFVKPEDFLDQGKISEWCGTAGKIYQDILDMFDEDTANLLASNEALGRIMNTLSWSLQEISTLYSVFHKEKLN